MAETRIQADEEQDRDFSGDDGPHAYPPAARMAATALSYIFHPVFVPVYVTLFLLFVHPLLFAGYDRSAKVRLLGTVLVNLTLLPAATVFFCRRLNFVQSLRMETQKERFIPLAASMIFYFWCWYVFKNLGGVPFLFKQFLLGGFLTIIAGWLANISFKISLHALAMGGMAGFLFLVMFTYEGGNVLYLALAVLAAGAVASARLVLRDHHPFEVYLGLYIGIFCQLLARWLS